VTEEQRPTPPRPPRADGVGRIVDLELRLCIEEGSASPHGYTRDRTGREEHFRGWLDLLGVLERVCARPPEHVETLGSPGVPGWKREHGRRSES